MRDSDGFLEESDDDLLDHEYPDEEPDEEDESDTVSCSQCGAAIYHDAVRCPVCGHYQTTPRNSVWMGRPMWWILLGLAGIFGTLFALLQCSPR